MITGTETALLASICGGAEAFKRAHRDVKSWVNLTYQGLLGRSASPSEQTFWATRSGNGRAAIVESIVGSPEYGLYALDGLYEAELGRKSGASWTNPWARQMSDRGQFTVAAAIASSPEFQAKAKA